jgi:hypothetical protein
MVLSKRETRTAHASKVKKRDSCKALKTNRTDTQKKVEKSLLEAIIKTVLDKEEEIKKEGRKRLPKCYLKNLVETYVPVFPSLTLKSLENAVSYQRLKGKKEKEASEEQLQLQEPTNITNVNLTTTQQQGRPKGTTQEVKRIFKIAHSAAFNEVMEEAAAVKHREGVLTQSAFNRILEGVKTRRNLPDHMEIKMESVKQRIRRNKLFLRSTRGKEHHHPWLILSQALLNWY